MSAPAPAGSSWPAPSRLDPSLPDLARALDPAEAARRFERRWPGPGPSPSIAGCTVEHVHWSPGVECRVTYRLTLSNGSAPAAITIGVVTATPRGVEHGLFSADPALPGLAPALDPAVMGGWFSEILDRRVEALSVTPMSYRPGSRCVLRYRLSGGGPSVVYGKLLAGGGFEALASTARSLGDDLVPPLVGVAPTWRLVAQEDAGDRSLRSVAAGVPSPAAAAELRAGGRLLSRLHGRCGPAGARRSLADDVDALCEHLAVARRVSPYLAHLMAEGIDRLGRVAGVAGPLVPGHGAFRLDQVHVGARGPLLIDLDSFCWAEPARDVGNLLAYLRWRRVRRPETAAAVAAVRAALLAGYAEAATAPLDPQRVEAFEAAAALKIAGRRLHRLAVDEWGHTGDLLVATLEGLGASAERAS